MAMETIVKSYDLESMYVQPKTKTPIHVGRNPLSLSFEEYMAELRDNMAKRVKQMEYYNMYKLK